jgi:hypothetical protein
LCETEEEADNVDILIARKNGLVCLPPVILRKRILKKNFTDNEISDMERFRNLGIIKMK